MASDAQSPAAASPSKPVTQTKIMGTDIPDVTAASAANDAMKRWMSRVAVTTAVLATLAAMAASFASSHLNESMIDQMRASDQWAYYQAKGVKLAILESKMETLPALGKEVIAADTARAERYKGEQAEISATAKGHEKSCEDHRRRYKIIGRSITAFQVAIALSAVALLMQRNWFWFLSMSIGVVGAAFLAWGMWPA